MALPYENATAGQKVIEECQKIVRSFGCNKFATGENFETGEIYIQFEHIGRMVQFKASAKGYAAAWLKENPYNNRKRCSKQDHEQKALEIGSIAVYSILRDQVKSCITAVECGLWSFETAFLSHIMLPSGKRVIEEVEERKLLPGVDRNV